jgi:cytochrome c peroxidase
MVKNRKASPFMKKSLTYVPSILAFALMVMNCGPSEETKALQERAKKTFGVLPAVMPGAENDTPERIALGKKLYFEKKLSANDQQSCNSCHNVDGKGAGVDNLPTSPGAFGKNGERNSPTTLNAGFHLAQFWDGRAKDLQAQAKGPILNPGEMAMPNEEAVIKKLSQEKEYQDLFAMAFPNDATPMTYENLAWAIASFERTLITRDRFEDFVNGDHKALSKEEQKGLQAFMDAGCTACHNGATFGGKSYMKLGAANPYPTEDLGRFNVTKNEADKFVFKVPSLKNVAMTYPYFHDGKVATLTEAIEKMAYHQLGKELPKDEVASIAKFLETLSDKSRTN